VDVHRARQKHGTSIEAKPFLMLLLALGRSQISSGLPISDTKLDGQKGSKSGSYFGGLGFKTRQAHRPSKGYICWD